MNIFSYHTHCMYVSIRIIRLLYRSEHTLHSSFSCGTKFGSKTVDTPSLEAEPPTKWWGSTYIHRLFKVSVGPSSP